MNRPIPLLLVALGLVVGLFAAACGDDDDDDLGDDSLGRDEDAALLVVTTVSPLRNIIENVGGDRIEVITLVPEGTNSHTFEPPPSVAKDLAEADLVVINGLNLELPALELAEASKGDGVTILKLGDETVSPDQFVFDFSFPEEDGNPNPHLWTDPTLASAYAELVENVLVALDPEATGYYRNNLVQFQLALAQLDATIQVAVATIPEGQRRLLTYHDSFPYFGPRYGFEILGAIQPSDFSDPSPREVASLIEQVREAGVPAIFGSEVFPSEVLDTIADEAGAVQVSDLRDDDLPGEQGDPENTYLAMMVDDVRTIVDALGGSSAAFDGWDTANTWIPFDEFAGP